ncbi:hypothetical protein BUE76_13005 [Cnuella takakiae]|nr:hypothetical protein BUE76_13005 [Cnuella takakiae]
MLLLAGCLFAQSTPTLSQIDIPIIVQLKPIYQLAEGKVDTLFTSPNYPKDWVQSDCATRYKYHFRRSPLRMRAVGNSMDLSFTGFYQIVGSTRLCTGTTVLSPWSPECSCGFKEPERRVEIGFTSSFRLLPDYRLLTTIARKEPKAIDKCTVCFWGQDVTTTVVTGLKAELDAVAKAIKDSFGVVNLRPWMQQAWNLLNTTYAIPNAGYFNLHPKSIRMEQPQAKNNMLQIKIGITAAPAVSFVKEPAVASALPNLSPAMGNEGFQINLEAALQYDSLSRVLNGMLAGKRFEVSEGLISKHVVVNSTDVRADSSGNLLIRVDFGGSFNGTVYFTGKPVYDPATKSVLVADLAYNLQSRSFLLNTAKWLFDKKIVGELRKRTVFPLNDYYDTAKVALNEWLNKEWTRGIRGEGSISDLQLETVAAQREHLLIRSRCNGKLVVKVSEIVL